MRAIGLLSALSLLALAACKPVALDEDRPEDARAFPRAEREVPEVVGNQFSTEAARDNRHEAETVMDLAGIVEGMTVADIGAGEGYYTVRLAEKVGTTGRVLAQDIDGDALARLGQRVSRDRLDNVSIKPGAIADPRLPANSFDRIFLVHMYHEVTEPYAFIWRMHDALRENGQIIVVDVDRPNGRHGISPKQLFCEFEAVGFELTEFALRPDIQGYFARFVPAGPKPEPEAVKGCNVSGKRRETE
ncbi:class I SAM-dependent methyltransferase [Alterisphingorhabdus coralli]|uniref:Class I SAM-dependent methyltransferase n=1 Tax=Alterisphingorhabdus coralli TaxID=3071408 RepID=A0AA97FC02_9SPHN|nr:class I SAM-dependent methyltransferase [Parasphingorhabdus sp. SCSIO 66989]WOE76270.1 class I SAM-dependent methyltransferase [Parasphingorhabdus sp. SCSIO 66989]